MTPREPYRGLPMSCVHCRQELVALGATPAIEHAAALAGPRCCTPTPHDAADLGKTARREAKPWRHTANALLIFGGSALVAVTAAWWIGSLIAHQISP